MTDLADAISPSAATAPAPSSWPSPNGSKTLPPPSLSDAPTPPAPTPTATAPAPTPAIAEIPAMPALEPVMTPAVPALDSPVTTATPANDHGPSPAPAPESLPAVAPSAEVEPAPAALVTGPAAILAPDTAIAPLDQSAISLPATPAAPPAPPATPAATNALFGLDELAPTGPKAKKKSGGRFGKFLVLAAVLGGLGYAGATYGPGLYDEYVADDEVAEQAAPLSFPRVRTTAPDVRTATFVLEGLATGSEADYTVTVDFDTHVSRVAIDRADAPDIEVLTFSEDALVRRLDSPTWYQIERGSFPLDDQLQRSDWIHMIDDLVPPERRAGVVIDDSTVATVAGVDTRHLVITLDPALLGIGENAVAPLDPMADIALAAENPDATTPPVDPTAPANAPAPVDATAPSAVPVGQAPIDDTTGVTPVLADADAVSETPAAPVIQTVPVAGDVVSANAVQIELWVDGQGVVRRSMGTDIFGANSITILETSPDAWVPDYPDAAQVEPMTAAALIELGL